MSQQTASNGVTDLALVVGLVGLAGGLLFLTDGTGPLTWLLAVPFLLVLPGYAVVAALRPVSFGDGGATASGAPGTGDPGWAIWIALSLATSVIAVGAIGVLLGVTVGVARDPAVAAISGFTVTCALIAGVRRGLASSHGRTSSQRAEPTGRRWLPGQTWLQTAVTAVALVALLSAVAFAASSPTDSEPYTEFYLLNESENGTLTATDVPETIQVGQGHPLHFGIENHEGESTTYDVVALSQTVAPNGSVTSQERIDQFNVAVPAGERVIVERTVAPTSPGEDRRLAFRLFTDGVPATPGAGEADLELHVWADLEGNTAS